MFIVSFLVPYIQEETCPSPTKALLLHQAVVLVIVI
jgi:hypothetical protein